MAAFRLKTHEKYVQLLWLLRTYTQYVEVVICYRDEPDNPLVLELKDLLIAREQVFQWQGTISYGDRPSTLYRYRAAEHLFSFLMRKAVRWFGPRRMKGYCISGKI